MPGKAHIALTHFPIALAITGFVFNLISVLARSEAFARTTRYVAVAAAMGAVGAVAAGFWALRDLGPVGDMAARALHHRLFGILAAAAIVVQAVWAFAARRGMSRGAAIGFCLLGLAASILVGYTGYLGGAIGD